MRAHAACIAVLAALPLPALAQPAGFEAAMDSALAPAGERAALVRCGGLYRAFRLYFGDDSEPGGIAQAAEADMATFAAIVWQAEDGLDLDAALEEVFVLIDAAAGLYRDRIVANLEAEGTVMDPDLEVSVGSCNLLRAQILEDLQ